MRRTLAIFGSWALCASMALLGLAIPRTAQAENFTGYTLTNDNGYNVVGIDANGNVAVETPFGCTSGDPNRCYDIFSNGKLVSQSDTLGSFVADDGMACSFSSATTEYQIGKSVCNGNNQVVGVRSNGQDQIVFVSYGGSDMVTVGTADLLFVNPAGDFVVVDGINGEIREFTPTPEVGTLVLLITAMAGIGALLYRRQRAH